MSNKLNEDFTNLYKRWKSGNVRNEEKNKYKTVDLGLPSGLLWCVCNIGATEEEDVGDYFSWGETKPKEDFSVDTYDEKLYGKFDVLPREYDAATVNLGKKYRTPTVKDFEELFENTECDIVTDAIGFGLKGIRYIGKNGNYIYLPATGFMEGTSRVSQFHIILWASNVSKDRGEYGCAWSTDAYKDKPKDTDTMHVTFGVNIRAVKEK